MQMICSADGDKDSDESVIYLWWAEQMAQAEWSIRNPIMIAIHRSVPPPTTVHADDDDDDDADADAVTEWLTWLWLGEPATTWRSSSTWRRESGLARKGPTARGGAQAFHAIASVFHHLQLLEEREYGAVTPWTSVSFMSSYLSEWRRASRTQSWSLIIAAGFLFQICCLSTVLSPIHTQTRGELRCNSSTEAWRGGQSGHLVRNEAAESNACH